MAPNAKSNMKTKTGGTRGKGSVKGKGGTKSRAAAPPPPPLPGSEEEVVALLKEQLSLHLLARPPPGSVAPSASVSGLYKENSRKLRKSIHTYTEYQNMHAQAVESHSNFIGELPDAQELNLRMFVMALDVVTEMVEAKKSQPEEARSELLTKEQWVELDAGLDDLEKTILEPHKGFFTKRPQWMPKDRMIINGDDEDFMVRPLGARKIDGSRLAPMPDIPDDKFYTGKRGNFTQMQKQAADSRYQERDMHKWLLMERDQMQKDVNEKDRQTKKLGEQKTENEEEEGTTDLPENEGTEELCFDGAEIAEDFGLEGGASEIVLSVSSIDGADKMEDLNAEEEVLGHGLLVGKG